MKTIAFNHGWLCNGQGVTLPHDAQISEKRSKDASNGGHGYFPGGTYTYEKTFTAPAEWEGKNIIIEFEGVYKNATVSLNGTELCFHAYGYTDLRPVNHPGVRPSKSVWRGTNAILSWGWVGCEGNKAEVEVYSDQASVELLLGGKSLGKKKIKECKALFSIKYAPGTLTAVAYDASGHEVSRSELSSAKGPFFVAVHPEKPTAKPSEIVYVPVNIEDSNGLVEANADRKVTVTVDGGELLAFGSANPCTEEQYHTGTFTTYYGRALAIVRAGDSGSLTVIAEDGHECASATVEITAEE